MSDTDSCEDENMKNIFEAVDTGFLNNKLYNSTTIDNTKEPILSKGPKSQRYLEIDDEEHLSDLIVTESVQTFIAKMFSAAIQKKYKFVDPVELDTKCYNLKAKPAKLRLRLLVGFDVPIRDIDGSLHEELFKKRCRPKIRKRDPEPDQLHESEKIDLAVMDSKQIESKKEIESWANRSRPDKLFQYKSGKDSNLHFVEPTDEFRVLRMKNYHATPMNVTLKTSDGQMFQVSMELLQYSKTLKYMIEVCGKQDTIVPLPKVNSTIFTKLIDWVNHQEEMKRGKNMPMETDETPPVPTDLTVDLCPGLLFQLIFTANYLGYEALVENSLNYLVDWLERNPFDQLENSEIPENINAAMNCLAPPEIAYKIEESLAPWGQKMERVLKPFMDEILNYFEDKEITKQITSLDRADAHAIYEDVKECMKFLQKELTGNIDRRSLENTFKEYKSEWCVGDGLKQSMSEALEDLDNDFKKAEKTLSFSDIRQFLETLNLSRASWTIFEMVQHLAIFLKELTQNSILTNMTKSTTVGSFLAIGNKLLLSECLNMILNTFAHFLKEPNLFQGLDKLVGYQSFFASENTSEMQTIKLLTSDGSIFPTNVKVGECQETMKILLKAVGLDENGVVPLPYVNKMVFEKILSWANYYQNTESSSIYESGLTRWENKFFSVDMCTLFELLWAADYLDIPGLLEATCQAIGVSLVGPSPKEIFNIVKVLPDFLHEFSKMYERHFYLYS